MTPERLPLMKFKTDYATLEFDVDVYGDGDMILRGGIVTDGDHVVPVNSCVAYWSSFRFELGWCANKRVVRICEHWNTYEQDEQEVLPINGGCAAEGARMVQVYCWRDYHIVVNRNIGCAFIMTVHNSNVVTLTFRGTGKFEFLGHEFSVTQDSLAVCGKSVILSPLS